MSMKIVYTHTARQDLREIYEYIAYTLLVPETARSLTDRIMADMTSACSLKRQSNGNSNSLSAFGRESCQTLVKPMVTTVRSKEACSC